MSFEDVALVQSLLIDLTNWSNWDEGKLTNFRKEIKEAVHRNGSVPRLSALFETSVKYDVRVDDVLEAIRHIPGFTVGERISIFHALLFSKVFSADSKRVLKASFGEVRSGSQLMDVPDDVKSSLLAVFQTEEFYELGQRIIPLLRDATGFHGQFGIAGDQQAAQSGKGRAVGLALEEVGSQCSHSHESFRQVLLSTGERLDEEAVASVLVSVLRINTRDEKRTDSPWNYEVIADVLYQECKGLNWANAVKHLDQPKFILRSEAEFQILVQLFIRISGSSIPPGGLLQGLWHNTRAQFTLLALLANAPRAVIDFSPFVTQDQLLQGDGISLPPNFSWVCHIFCVRLLDLSTNNLTMEVLEVMMKAAAVYPEYLLSTLAVIQHPSPVRNEVIQRLLPLFSGLPGSRASSLVMMRRLFVTNTDLLFRLCYVTMKRATKTSEIVMVENIVKNMGGQYLRRLEADNTLDDLLGYWCVKAERHELALDEKIASAVDGKNVRLLLSFAKHHAEHLRGKATGQQTDALLSLDTFGVILKHIQMFPGSVTPEEVKPLLLLFAQLQQVQNGSFSGGRDIVSADTVQEVRQESDDVETLANAYFQKIYTTDIAIADVIQLLRQFKTSSEKKEQELFRCMVHNLFDEYRFFHKYPEKELVITARMFGALIQHQLVSSITLGIALRYVLEALRKDPELGDGNDKMFRFGQIALDQFRSRLGEWPQYCSHLIQIPHLSRLNPELFQEAQRALSAPQNGGMGSNQFTNNYELASQGFQNVQTGSLLQTAFQPFSATPISSASASMFTHELNSTHQVVANRGAVMVDQTPSLWQQKDSVESPQMGATEKPPSAQPQGSSSQWSPQTIQCERDRMLSVNQPVEETVLPADTTRDNIHFIVNNIAKSNVEAKALELKEVLKPELFPWFANYLVEKRVSSQPNLHGLYLTMLDIMDSGELNKLVIDSTLYNVTKFLSSPNITSSTSERSILRHFGMWLGQMTLARNKPLLQRKINLKTLVFWGYETGHLIAVCPFVAKVVEGVKDSKVFRPPNPWLMAILGVLKELAEIEDLKLNIKFEVQVLCKNINVSWDEIVKSNVLLSCKQPVKDSKNPDFNSKVQSQAVGSASTAQSQPTAGTGGSTVSPSVPSLTDSKSQGDEISGQSMQLQGVQEGLNQLILQAATSVVINPSFAFFSSNPNQRRVVSVAVERGIREISTSAIERSVTLATTTTKQLLLKDFVTEDNEASLRRAAQAMVSSLAGSLSLAICKEPLRISISNHLRTLLASSISDQAAIEQIASVCANDNIELGSSLIEKVSIDRAVLVIEETISEALTARKAAKEGGQLFIDGVSQSLPTRIPAEVQDMLKPSSKGLNPSQLQLYESFGKPIQQSVPATLSAPDTRQPPTSGSISMTQALEAYQVIYGRLDQSLRNVVSQAQAQGRDVTLSMLGQDHEVIQFIKDLVVVTQKIVVGVKNETAMTFCESIFNKLFDSAAANVLRLEVFVYILDAVREACGGPKAFNPDFIAWLGKYSSAVSDEFSRRLYRHVLLLLIKFKLVRPQDLDLFLVAHMENGSNIFWLELALTFVKQCVAESFCSVYDFSVCIDAIQQMRPANINVRKSLAKWLLDIKAMATGAEERRSISQPPAVSKEVVAAKQHVSQLLEKWLAICNNITDQLLSQFLQLLQQVGVFRSDESTEKFFRYSVEICVEASVKSQDSFGSMNYTIMDGLSKLFTLLIRVADKEAASDPSSGRTSLTLTTKMLNAVTKVLLEDHEAKKHTRSFDQRPYFRVLSTMAQDFGIPSDDRLDLILPLVAAHCQCYIQLQPLSAPSFSFSWLSLISKRTFLPYLLKNQKAWPLAHKLLSALLNFLHPLLRTALLVDSVKRLYKGTLRIFLIILHDFPEFLSEYHASLCDMIPHNCVQLRNLVLSAFPRGMRLPDPFASNMRWESFPEIHQSPRVLVDNPNILMSVKPAIDSYLSALQPIDFPQVLATGVSGSSNLNLISAIVLYIGTQSVMQPLRNACSELLRGLAVYSDQDTRFLILNSVVNQLRYPNAHTYFFSSALLAIFARDVDNEIVQEQIVRILLERLAAHRPHPWGLLVTFTELIRNPKFNFWRKSFIKSSTEVERMIETLARSCLGANVSTT